MGVRLIISNEISQRSNMFKGRQAVPLHFLETMPHLIVLILSGCILKIFRCAVETILAKPRLATDN